MNCEHCDNIIKGKYKYYHIEGKKVCHTCYHRYKKYGTLTKKPSIFSIERRREQQRKYSKTQSLRNAERVNQIKEMSIEDIWKEVGYNPG